MSWSTVTSLTARFGKSYDFRLTAVVVTDMLSDEEERVEETGDEGRARGDNTLCNVKKTSSPVSYHRSQSQLIASLH